MAKLHTFLKLFDKLFSQQRRDTQGVCLGCECRDFMSGKTLCQTCFSDFLQHQSWTGCARCGQLECANCNENREFISVTSLFRLDSYAAHLLIQAKDQNDLLAQKMLEDIGKFTLMKETSRIVKNERISHIVIAPLRRDRLLNSSWHPSVLLEKSCRRAGVQVIVPTIMGVERQSVFSAEERGLRQQRQRPELVFPNSSKLQKEEVSGVLFVDDVLTTGGSAHRTRCILPENFSSAPWHVLTLFRSPRKGVRRVVENVNLCLSQNVHP
jgi:predicted amidophosphoribosyltransferase